MLPDRDRVSGSGPRASGHQAGLITVVVPAYNVGPYLGACIEALHRQTAWADCRVIVVDDGSTDHTRAVATAAAGEDSQITCVVQHNRGPGPGAARNRGLDLTDSEFILFCDGDDELTPRGLELLRDGLRRHSLDLAVGAGEQFPTPRRWLWSDYFVPGRVDAVAIEDVPLLIHNANTGTKMFRTAWLRRRGWRFAEGIHHQDTVVTVPALLDSPRLALIGDVVHRYRKRLEGGSIMDAHYTRLQNYWDHLLVIETLSERLDLLAAPRRRLLETFIVRSFQGFSWRAPEILPRNRLAEFFERTQSVVRRVRPESIMTATRSAVERSAYVTMLENDLETFTRLGTHLDLLQAAGGHLYLSIPTSQPEHRAMLRTAETRALAESLTVCSETISFDLRVRVRGVRDLRGGLNGLVLRFQPDGGRPVLTRELDLNPLSGSECHARIRLPRASLAPGRYHLRLAFRTPTGQVLRWVRRPRSDRPHALITDEVVPDPDTGHRFALRDASDHAVLDVWLPRLTSDVEPTADPGRYPRRTSWLSDGESPH